ncbi:hypothetical protein WKI71_25700 [Streptomyces sp. MS1.AVA.1]|uniref:Uncharacterized protein n=1 Tax=Streptomyces machairae TaxID=3134109 RepID=A0ABU8UPS6_9ACTN
MKVTFSFGCCLFQRSIIGWTEPVVSLPATYVMGPRPSNDGAPGCPESVPAEEEQAVMSSPPAASAAEHRNALVVVLDVGEVLVVVTVSPGRADPLETALSSP